MSLNLTLYANFDVYNYKGTTSLTGYALPGNAFTCVADLTGAELPVSLKNVTWDFGDGYQTNELTPSHVYTWPGTYTISLVVYNASGDAAFSTVTQTVSVFDLLDNELYADCGSTYFQVPAGNYAPFTITRHNSWQTYSALSATGYTVNLYVSGSADPVVDLNLYYNDAWSHLKRNSIFFQKNTTQAGVEYVPVSAVTTIDTLIYAKQDVNQNYVLCESTDAGALFVGTTGYAVPYFTSHTPHSVSAYNSPALIFCTLDNTLLQDQFTNLVNYFQYNTPSLGYMITRPATLPVYVTYSPATQLSFTTNGIDTQGDAVLTSFEIPYISWQEAIVPFVIKLKDANQFTTLFYPRLSSNVTNMSAASGAYNIKLALVSNNTTIPGVSFYQDFSSTLPLDSGGYFKGYFISPTSATNCVLSASVTVIDPTYYINSTTTAGPTTATITGTSNVFNLNPWSGVYGIAKVNENFDMTAFYDSLRLTESLMNANVLFDKFLHAIVGSSTGAQYEMGKTIYERIANFCSNINDIDTATVDSLISLCTQYGVNTGDVAGVSYPPQLRRIVDLLSIKRSKLMGTQSKYNKNLNLNIRFSQLDTTNIGAVIDINTGTFSLSEQIIAFEQFSQTYKIVKLPALSGYTLSSTFYLSAYSPFWNLGLVLQDSVTGADIGNYYKFYRYQDSSSPPFVNSVINWKDPLTTLSPYSSSYADWVSNDGIMDTILNYEITKGLRLFTSAVNIEYNN